MLLFLQGNYYFDDWDDFNGDFDNGDDEYHHSVSRPSSDEPHRLGRTRSTSASLTNSKWRDEYQYFETDEYQYFETDECED